MSENDAAERLTDTYLVGSVANANPPLIVDDAHPAEDVLTWACVHVPEDLRQCLEVAQRSSSE